LLYVAIFAMVSGMFTGILVIILRVQGQQGGLVEVSNQLNFAMGRIQSLIRESNPAVAPVAGTPPSSLTLSIAGSSTLINLSGTEIQVNGVPINTDKVKVEDLKFIVNKLTNPSAADLSLPDTYSVDIEMTISNVTTNPQNLVTRTLKGSASPIAK
jgi:hypothetical protein